VKRGSGPLALRFGTAEPTSQQDVLERVLAHAVDVAISGKPLADERLLAERVGGGGQRATPRPSQVAPSAVQQRTMSRVERMPLISAPSSTIT
jgi:hypothetical protein